MCHFRVSLLWMLLTLAEINDSHVCFLQKHTHPNKHTMYSWTLSSDNETRCQCTKILVPRFLTLPGNENGIPCDTSTNAADRYWVHDDKVSLLTKRTIWNTEYFKTLLDCGSEADLPTTSASILATTETLVQSTSQFSSLSTTPECSTPLGMESGEIPNSNIIASSLRNGRHAHEARLNNGLSWEFLRNDTNPWVQVTLLRSSNISGIFVQGSPWGNWFKSLQIQIGSEASSLAYITDDESNHPLQFQTNMDWQNRTMVYYISLPHIVTATVVRLEPKECRNKHYTVEAGCTVNFEIIGC